MGSWGYEAWESDGAADWFGSLFKSVDVDAHLDRVLAFDDLYEELRAAGYLLCVLGHSPYSWPGDPDKLPGFRDRVLERLRAMAAPGSEFLELSGGDPGYLRALEGEIKALEATKG